MIVRKGSFLADLLQETCRVGVPWGIAFLVLLFGLPLALLGLQFAAQLPIDVNATGSLPTIAVSVAAGLAVAAVLWSVGKRLWSRDIVYLLVAFHFVVGERNALSVVFGTFVLFCFCADLFGGIGSDGAPHPIGGIQSRFRALFARLTGDRT